MMSKATLPIPELGLGQELQRMSLRTCCGHLISSPFPEQAGTGKGTPLVATKGVFEVMSSSIFFQQKFLGINLK